MINWPDPVEKASYFGQNACNEHPARRCFDQEARTGFKTLSETTLGVKTYMEDSTVINQQTLQATIQPVNTPKSAIRRFRKRADGVNLEEELVLNGNILAYTEIRGEAHITKRTFILPKGNNFVCWAQYIQNDLKSRVILRYDSLSGQKPLKRIDCISVINFSSNLLHTYSNNGRDYTTHIPFPISRLYPTSMGVLIERTGSRAMNTGAKIPQKLPKIFSLFHPLCELAPVLVVNPHSYLPINQDSMAICFTDERSDLVLLYNSKESVHVLCRLRQVSVEEMNCSLEAHREVASSLMAQETPTSFCNDQRDNSHLGTLTTPLTGKSQAQSSTPVAYQLRSRLASTPNAIQSPALQRVKGQLQGQVNISPIVAPPGRSRFNKSESFAAKVTRTMSSSMLSRLNANVVVMSDPVLPDLSLEIVYTDKFLLPSPAQKARIVEDLVGTHYFVFYANSMKKLRVISQVQGSFRNVGDISCYGFEYLDGLKLMLLITGSEGNMALYSGVHKLCSVQNPLLNVSTKMLAPPSTKRGPRTSASGDVMDFIAPVDYILKEGGGTTVYLLDVLENCQYRLRLPPIDSCETVERFISALGKILQAETMILIKSKWYISLNSIKFPGSPVKEVSTFLSLLLELIGFEVDEGKPHKRQRTEDEDSSDEDWLFMLNFEATRLGCPSFKTVNVLSPLCYHVLFALHLVYEEVKTLNVLMDQCKVVAEYLCHLSSSLALSSYREYYLTDFPSIRGVKELKHPERGLRDISPPTFFQKSPPSLMRFLFMVFAGNSNDDPFPLFEGVTQNLEMIIKVFGLLIKDPTMSYIYMKSSIESLAVKVSDHTLVQVLSEKKISKMNIRLAYRYVFNNLLQQLTHRSHHEFSEDLYTLLGRGDLSRQVKLNNSKKPHSFIGTPSEAAKGGDGFENLFNEMLTLRFGDDYRIKDVCDMFQSSAPVVISVQQSAGVSDHDFAEQQERQLYSLCVRTLALPVGRGMFTLHTVNPIISEPIPVAHLNLTGRVPPKNTTVELRTIDTPTNMTQWPYFHNGVAAGLRVASTAKDVTSSWISLNESLKQSSDGSSSALDFGGFIMGLGLSGHLKSANPVFLCDNLRKRNPIIAVGVLLGVGASKKATMDLDATKLISIHIDALLPSTATELDEPSECRVAAISALGLLYLGSGHQHTSDVLLSEIGRPPGPEMEHCVDRESHSLSAGMALGMVMLCKGGVSSQVSQTKLSNTLYNLMVGGPTQMDPSKNHRSPSYQIREGDHINITVTSPGATIALGLIYHATENQNIASLMNVPETQYLLDTVQPDYLLLRTLCKGLILWSTVHPSKEWVSSHLTNFLKENAFKSPSEEVTMDTVDYEGATQAYCNVLAGACFALGLKFAGSSNRDAFNTLHHYTMFFYDIHKKPSAEQAGKNTIETCLLVCLISMSLTMAGTGDLEVLRICRVLRKRVAQGNNCVFYGSHMMIHMAIGFLFLGGGSLTLSTRPEAIAALLCALYPKFPTHFSDNRYHLQALRHLYVLAVEPRLLVCHDVLSNRLVKSRVKVSLQDGDTIVEYVAPCNLPALHLVKSVTIDDERYWEIVFDDRNMNILRDVFRNRSYVFVKQKAGCLSYSEDPKGYKTRMAQSDIKQALRGSGNMHKMLSNLESFSNTPIVSKFVENLLLPGPDTDKLQNQMCSIVMECAAREQLELLPVLADLLFLQVDMGGCTFNLQQFKLIKEFVNFETLRGVTLCGRDIVRDRLNQIETQVVQHSEDTDSAEFHIWFGRKKEHLSRNVDLPSLFFKLRGDNMSVQSIVHLYNTLTIEK